MDGESTRVDWIRFFLSPSICCMRVFKFILINSDFPELLNAVSMSPMSTSISLATASGSVCAWDDSGNDISLSHVLTGRSNIRQGIGRVALNNSNSLEKCVAQISREYEFDLGLKFQLQPIPQPQRQ